MDYLRLFEEWIVWDYLCLRAGAGPDSEPVGGSQAASRCPAHQPAYLPQVAREPSRCHAGGDRPCALPAQCRARQGIPLQPLQTCYPSLPLAYYFYSNQRMISITSKSLAEPMQLWQGFCSSLSCMTLLCCRKVSESKTSPN